MFGRLKFSARTSYIDQITEGGVDMSGKILLIGENPQSFLLKVLTKSLEEASYEVRFCLPDRHYLEMMVNGDDFPEIVVLYLERIEDSKNSFFPCIERLVEKNQRIRLYFIGSLNEINQAYESINRNHVKHAFERPIDTQTFLKALEFGSGDYSLSDEVKKIKLDADKLTILVIDDEAVQLHAMERWLQKNYNVITEKSGTDGIALLKQYKVDMILLDYEMPILSGYDVFHILKNDPETADIPIVFLTGNNESETVKQVVRLNPAGYLLKNTAPAILVQKIDAIFDKLFSK